VSAPASRRRSPVGLWTVPVTRTRRGARS
jgi:hypothetical protein